MIDHKPQDPPPGIVEAIAHAAHGYGHCLDCAICGRPFTSARRPKAAGILGDRDRYPGAAARYLLCRQCARLPREEKRRRLFEAAEAILQHQYLATATPEGNA